MKGNCKSFQKWYDNSQKGPKNEASTLKSLKLAKIKDLQNDVFLEHPNGLISINVFSIECSISSS